MHVQIRFIAGWLIQVMMDDSALVQKLSEHDSSMNVPALTRCVDVTSFLLGNSFTKSGAELTPKYPEVYSGISASSQYIHRLPLWQLIDDIWGVLSPLMLSGPEMSSKLALLCGPLSIDQDTFHSKRLMSSYPAMHMLDHGVASSEQVRVVEQLKDFRDNLQCIRRPVVRLDVWRWAFEREKERGNWKVSERILNAALEDTASDAPESSSKDSQLAQLRGQLRLQLVRLQCQNAIFDLNGQISGEIGSYDVCERLLESLTLSNCRNAERAQRIALEYITEVGWDTQLKVMQSSRQHQAAGSLSRVSALSDALCVRDVLLTRHFPQTIAFVARGTAAVEKIYNCCATLDKHVESILGNKENSLPPSTEKGQNPFESTRHQYISRILAEGISACRSTEAPQSSSSASSSHSGKQESGSSASQAQSKRGPGGSLWSGVLGIGDSTVSPTEAGQRRRADAFSAFAISLLVACCNDGNSR
jgi:hypothetical protein